MKLALLAAANAYIWFGILYAIYLLRKSDKNPTRLDQLEFVLGMGLVWLPLEVQDRL